MLATQTQHRKSQKRNAIVAAAVKIFSEKGFHSARVSDIAKRAGVADGTIYLYFRSKDDILITIFEDKMGEMIEVVRGSVEERERWDAKVRAFVHCHLEQVAANPELASVLQVELRLSNKFMKEYVPYRLQEYLDLLGDVLRQGQDSGEVRQDVNPVIVRRALFGAIDEIAMQWVLSDRRYCLADTAREVAEIFVCGLRAQAQQKE